MRGGQFQRDAYGLGVRTVSRDRHGMHPFVISGDLLQTDVPQNEEMQISRNIQATKPPSKVWFPTYLSIAKSSNASKKRTVDS